MSCSITYRTIFSPNPHIHSFLISILRLGQVNAILASFKRLKANATEGGRPYREETIEYKDTIDGLNILVREILGSGEEYGKEEGGRGRVFQAHTFFHVPQLYAPFRWVGELRSWLIISY